MNCQIKTKQNRACHARVYTSEGGVRRCYFHRNATLPNNNVQTVVELEEKLTTLMLEPAVEKEPEIPSLSESEEDDTSLSKEESSEEDGDYLVEEDEESSENEQETSPTVDVTYSDLLEVL